MNSKLPPSDSANMPVVKKAGLRQVAATMFWGLFMIGKKDTWEKDGATVTLFQLIVGGVITAVLVILVLIMIVSLVVRK